MYTDLLSLEDCIIESLIETLVSSKWTSTPFECLSSPDNIELADIISTTQCVILRDGGYTFSTALLHSSHDVDDWLVLLSKKNVEDLHLTLGLDDLYVAPTCLFLCTKLKLLELVRCELQLPLHFEGFLNLKCLTLQEVVIAPDDIYSLIKSCPLLEALKLSYNDCLELTLCAPKLKHLTIEGEFVHLWLKKTPMLINLSVSLYLVDEILEHSGEVLTSNFERIMCGAASIQRISGRIYFTKYMSIGNHTLGRSNVTYQQLKVIELQQVNFEDMNEVIVVLRLLSSAPNLEVFRVSGCLDSSATTEAPDVDFWVKECISDKTFGLLKRIEMTDVFWVPHEIGFIKFLLGCSPVLESMTITPSEYMTHRRSDMLVKLLSFRRASAQAEIQFVEDHMY